MPVLDQIHHGLSGMLSKGAWPKSSRMSSGLRFIFLISFKYVPSSLVVRNNSISLVVLKYIVYVASCTRDFNNLD